MMQANPQMRALMESNPELAHILNDPQMLRQSLQALTIAAVIALPAAEAADCDGQAMPGPRNEHPIDSQPPVFVKSVPFGKKYTVGQGDDRRDLLHLWGTPYQNGLAMGQLLGPKLDAFITEVYHYTEGQILQNLGNTSWCGQHVVRCAGLRALASRGGLSRLLAALRTRHEPLLRRSGPEGRAAVRP